MWTSCLSDHQRRGRPSPQWDRARRHRHRRRSTQYLLIGDFIFLCVSYSSSIFYHVVCRLNLVNSASVCGRRRGGWGGGESEAPVSSGQQSPCSGRPISQHRTRALNKPVIIRSTAAAAVIVKMEFQPTWLSWGGGGGGGDRKTVALRHTAPAGGHLQEKYFRKRAFVQRVGELATPSLEIENWN